MSLEFFTQTGTKECMYDCQLCSPTIVSKNRIREFALDAMERYGRIPYLFDTFYGDVLVISEVDDYVYNITSVGTGKQNYCTKNVFNLPCDCGNSPTIQTTLEIVTDEDVQHRRSELIDLNVGTNQFAIDNLTKLLPLA